MAAASLTYTRVLPTSLTAATAGSLPQLCPSRAKLLSCSQSIVQIAKSVRKHHIDSPGGRIDSRANILC